MAKRKRGGKPGNKSGQQWADHLTQRAKSEGYPARSVYKLQEIQQKFRIMKPGDTVLDLGCSPGSWLLYASRQVGKGGQVLGIDLKPVETKLPANALAVEDDILDMQGAAFLDQATGCRVVISDMAPPTTGRKDVDAIRSFELCRMALDVARQLLAENGNFVCKIFQGNEFKQLENDVRKSFRDCRIFKPESCRKQSKEIYIIGIGKR